jgi:hypothetical protein
LIEEKTVMADSIIQSVQTAVLAIQVHSGTMKIDRCTILGTISAHRLFASEVLITAMSDIDDTQTGCFRFGAAPSGSRLPRPYESFLFDTDNNHWLVSRRFGQPGYAQLSDTAPRELVRGAENGAEIGAFNSLLNALKQEGLNAKIEEYMPFGLIPAFVNKT